MKVERRIVLLISLSLLILCQQSLSLPLKYHLHRKLEDSQPSPAPAAFDNPDDDLVQDVDLPKSQSEMLASAPSTSPDDDLEQDVNLPKSQSEEPPASAPSTSPDDDLEQDTDLLKSQSQPPSFAQSTSPDDDLDQASDVIKSQSESPTSARSTSPTSAGEDSVSLPPKSGAFESLSPESSAFEALLPESAIFEALPPESGAFEALSPESSSFNAALPPTYGAFEAALPPEYGAFKGAPSPSIMPPSSSDAPFASLEKLLTIPGKLRAMPAPPQVAEACAKADYPSECEATLLSLVEQNGNGEAAKALSNPVKILDSSVKVFSKALDVAKSEIFAKKSTFKADDPALSTCKELYDDAVEELTKAMEAANAGDKYGANIRLSAALTFIETCEDGLHDAREDGALASVNSILTKLASNSLSLENFAFGDTDDDDDKIPM
ncbi:hypothetical protein Droror1_Dr00022275 [Drosera rotundifolia]